MKKMAQFTKGGNCGTIKPTKKKALYKRTLQHGLTTLSTQISAAREDREECGFAISEFFVFCYFRVFCAFSYSVFVFFCIFGLLLLCFLVVMHTHKPSPM